MPVMEVREDLLWTRNDGWTVLAASHRGDPPAMAI